ncbi:MAG: chemotaxis protein CheW [Anaeromyxobacter sp.]|nr:chemotaxis protein CheW [Anaeromyxobacter sp.]
MAEPLLICTFTLAGQEFALPVSQIQEVVRHLTTTPVPLAPPAVRGLANLRGTVATSIDLRRRLGLPDRAVGAGEVTVVVRGDEGPVCLVVDDVGDVVEIDPDSLERAPETLRPAVRELVRGICRLHDHLILLLDTTRALEAGAPRAAAAAHATEEETP